MFNLAVCYQKGYGVEHDNEKTLYWLKQASDKGHVKAKETYTYLTNLKLNSKSKISSNNPSKLSNKVTRQVTSSRGLNNNNSNILPGPSGAQKERSQEGKAHE